MRLDRQRVCHSARPTAAKVACRAPRLQRTPITATPPSPSQQTNMHYLRRRRLVVLVQGVAKLRLNRFLDSKGTRLVGLVRAGRLGQLAAPSSSRPPGSTPGYVHPPGRPFSFFGSPRNVAPSCSAWPAPANPSFLCEAGRCHPGHSPPRARLPPPSAPRST